MVVLMIRRSLLCALVHLVSYAASCCYILQSTGRDAVHQLGSLFTDWVIWCMEGLFDHCTLRHAYRCSCLYLVESFSGLCLSALRTWFSSILDDASCHLPILAAN